MAAIDRRTSSPETSAHLSTMERTLSAVLGLGLAAVAVRPRPNPALSLIALVAGSYLAWRGSTGRDPFNLRFLDDDRA